MARAKKIAFDDQNEQIVFFRREIFKKK